MFLPEQVDECSEDKSLDILQYIQANIYKTGKIRAKDISQHIGISENYLGRYIKKHTNETMQQYILNYKLKLVENRLLHSQMRICEIVTDRISCLCNLHKISPAPFWKRPDSL